MWYFVTVAIGNESSLLISLSIPEVTNVINMMCILPDLLLHMYQYICNCACVNSMGLSAIKILLSILFCRLLFLLINVSWNSFLSVWINVYRFPFFDYSLIFPFYVFHSLYYHSTKLFYILKCWNLPFWHIKGKHSWLKSIVKFLLQDIKKHSNFTICDHHWKYFISPK